MADPGGNHSTFWFGRTLTFICIWKVKNNRFQNDRLRQAENIFLCFFFIRLSEQYDYSIGRPGCIFGGHQPRYLAHWERKRPRILRRELEKETRHHQTESGGAVKVPASIPFLKHKSYCLPGFRKNTMIYCHNNVVSDNKAT